MSTRNRFAVSIIGAAIALLVVSPIASAQNGGAIAPRIVSWSCSGCHRVDGNAPLPDFPRLAGFEASYIEQKVAAFQAAPALDVVYVPIGMGMLDVCPDEGFARVDCE